MSVPRFYPAFRQFSQPVLHPADLWAPAGREPSILPLLDDEIVRLLMRSDAVSLSEVLRLIEHLKDKMLVNDNRNKSC